MTNQTMARGLDRGVIWPHWRAVLARLQRLAQARGIELLGRANAPAITPFLLPVPVPCSQVLMVVLEHELWKHPQRHPGDEVLKAAHGNQEALCTLLANAGWARWRIRRISSLQWSLTELKLEDLSSISLTPMSWVFQLGTGSNRAENVARGAATALATGNPINSHVAAIRSVREQPPRTRALVVRQSGNEFIVEDGNHFVVALLLSRLSTRDDAIKVPAYTGTHVGRRGRLRVLKRHY